MSNTHEFKIGADTFMVLALNADKTWELQGRLAPIAAEVAVLYGIFMGHMPALFRAAGSSGALDKDLAVALPELLTSGEHLGAVIPAAVNLAEDATAVITRLCSKLPPGELTALRVALLEGATINGKLLVNQGKKAGEGDLFTTAMRGRTIDTWKLLIAAVRTSFPDFFPTSLGEKGELPAGAASPSAGSSI